MSDNNKDGGCGCLIILAIIIILTRGAAVPIIILLVLFFMAVGLISSLKDKLFKSGNSGSSSETWNNSYGDNRNSSYGDNRNSNSSGRSSEHHETEYIEFISAVCRICGYISRAGGAITKEQIDLVSRLIDTSEVPLRVKSRLQKDFNTGKSENFDPYDTCRSIRNEFSDPDLQNFILNVLLSLIYSDNVVTELELQRLYQVTDLLSIERAFVVNKIREYEFISGFTRARQHQYRREERSYSGSGNSGGYSGGGSSNSGGYSGRGSSSDSGGYSGRSGSSSQGINSRSDALRILGLSDGASAAEIKRAYLKLMKEYHPDRLKAKGITGSLKKEYEEKCKLITEAYNYLK